MLALHLINLRDLFEWIVDSQLFSTFSLLDVTWTKIISYPSCLLIFVNLLAVEGRLWVRPGEKGSTLFPPVTELTK